MSRIDLAAIESRILQLGYETVREYQEEHGLVPDGVIGRITARSVLRPRFCGRPERERAGRECPWPEPQVRWHVRGELLDVTHQEFARSIERAWSLWTAVCGIEPIRVDEPAEANLLIFPYPLGGPGGTLADSMLPPCGLKRNNIQLEQRFDDKEPFHPGDWSACPPEEIPLVVTAAHEIGHAIAFRHRRDGLMQPSLIAGVPGPNAREAAIAREWYGPPKTESGPAPKPPASRETRKAILSVAGYKIVTVQLEPL